ncbi:MULTISPECIES: FMN reductase [Subtercola]|uniref:NADPH-dependent FMN reductase n=1 Tax=Subtercola vilae TaxID=2056433 RepID=A0A4T2BFP7_9MICO|nr:MULTISPECIES: FMN reductase [Subtercola]MEA9987019.1 FMN reductase [Subtercola sp. RTI3]TIH29072.1 NADPH-dependent FMN reductase [Subtercola vilae]
MATKKLVVVSAGLGQPSSTRLLADRLTTATREHLSLLGDEVSVEVIELRDLAHDITNNLLTGFAPPKLQVALDALSSADGMIAVTPIFTTSYSGLFKSFIDVIEPTAVTDLAVVIGATGGTERHSLALDYAMRPLFAYLHAVVVPTAVYAASSDWGTGAGAGSTALPDRVSRAAGELAALMHDSVRSSRVVDPFALPSGFSPTGSYGEE